MTTIREVLRRWLRGQAQRGIASATGVDRKTVARYVKTAEELGLSPGNGDAALTDEVIGAVARKVQVGAKVQAGSGWAVCVEYREQLLGWHQARAAGPKLVKLLQRQSGKSVSLRTLQRFMQVELAKAKGSTSSCYVADCAPGEELQVDYEVLGPVQDADSQTRRTLHAFVCTAVHSRHTFVYPCWHESTETTIEALEAAWEFFGGVFGAIIPDNLKAVVIKPDPIAPVFNDIFLEYSQARDFLIGPARVRKPKDKGRVENANKYTQSSLFAGETYSTIAQWRQAAEVWCRDEAGTRTHGTTGRQPLQHFEQVEQPALKSKPLTSWEMPRWVSAKVGRDDRIRVENSWYRLAKGLQGESVRVRLDRSTVRVLYKNEPLHMFARVEARQTGGLTQSAEPSAQDSIASRSPEQLLGQAAEHGAHIGEVARRLLGRQLWFSQVRKVLHIFKLCERYGNTVVNTACEKLLAVDEDDPVRVERVVKLGLEARVQSADFASVSARTPATSTYARANQTWQIPGFHQGEEHVSGPQEPGPAPRAAASATQAGATERYAA